MGAPRQAEAEMGRFKKSQIDAEIAKAKKETRLWDDDPRGLGLRIKPNGTATFFIQYRSPITLKKVRHSIDQYGRLTIDQARTEAKRLYENIRKGQDPGMEKRRARSEAKIAATVSKFCDDYMRDADAGLVTYRGKAKKASTLAIDRGRIERHIKPTLGEKLVRDVTSKEIEKAMHDIRRGKTKADVKTGPRGRAIVTGGAGTAAKAVTLLGSIFSYAIKQGIRTDNPASEIELPPAGKRDRVLSPEEYMRLGEALDALEAKGANPVAIRAYRVLALTGCRRGEIFGLLNSEVDTHYQCLRFGDTKTGQQVRAIGRPALDLLSPPPFEEKSEEQKSKYVFPAAHGNGHFMDTKTIRKVCQKAELEGVTLHTLRHSFASVALELEYSEMTIAGLLGHRQSSVTSRYAHSVDRALVAAANRVASLIAARLDGREVDGATVVSLNAG